MMPKEEYDKQRNFYFQKYVAPHYKSDADRTAGQTKFLSLTERKPLLTTGEKATLPASIAASEFFAKAEGTLSAAERWGNEHINKHLWGYEDGKKTVTTLEQAQKTDESKVGQLEKVAAREGVSTRARVGKAVGELGEMGVELSALGGAGDAVQGLVKGLDLIKAGSSTAKYLGYTNRVIKGGPTFAVYEGLHDEKGLAHSFIDGTFLDGLVEGRLWTFASSGKLVSRVLKGGVVGAGIGAAHSDESNRSEGALVGGLGGAAFGLLPGEGKVSTKDEALHRSLNPELNKPLNPSVDESLSKNVVQSTAKSQREAKAPEINIDETVRGVKIRMIGPKGEEAEIIVSPYAEGRAIDAVQKATMAGGHVEGIDYSTTHGDTLNRFLHMQKVVGNGDKATEARIALEAKQPTEQPSKSDTMFHDLQTADRVMLTHSNLPKGSTLFGELNAAKKTARDSLSQIKENIIWTANKTGATNEERKYLNYQLSTLVNNRNQPVINPQVNESLRSLAYKPELRDLIPPQFRSSFDTAVLQSPKGTRFETSLFSYKGAYRKLEPISPRRTPDELIEMSKLLTVVGEGEPKLGLSESSAQHAGRMKAYSEAYNSSLKYPEIGQALPPSQQPAWGVARQRQIDSEVRRNNEHQKQVLTKPTPPKRSVEEMLGRGSVNDTPQSQALASRMRAAQELPDLENVEVSEIDKVMQDEIANKSRGITAPGVAEEFLRTGQWTKETGKKTLATELKIPPAEERTQLTMGENARVEQVVLKVYVPSHVIDRNFNMAGAFYQPHQILEVLDDLGFKDHPPQVIDYVLQGKRIFDPMNGNLLAGYGNGMVVLPAENPAEHEFHELLHHAVDHISGIDGYYPEQFGLSDSAIRTMDQIRDELKQFDAYRDSRHADMNEEAFVHAATAVVKGDKQVLAGMGLVDTSVSAVLDMVHSVSSKALTKLQSRPDWEELRHVKDRFDAVQKSSSPMVSYSLKRAADKLLSAFYTDAEGAVHFDGEDTSYRFDSKNDAFQHLLLNDNSAEAPSWTMPLEQMGILTDSPTLARFSPAKNPPSLTPSTDAKYWQGRMALSSLFRPLLPWVADAQKKLNDHWMGLEQIPLLDKVRKVDEAFANSSNWMDTQRETLAKDLKHFTSEKLYDVFNFISVDPKSWPRMAGKYNMSPEDMTHVQNLYSQLRNLDATNHLGVFNYFLRELPLLRANNFRVESVYPQLADPSKASTFHRGMLEGRFKASDTHAGRFLNFVLKASQDKILDPAIRDLNSTVNVKDKNGDYVLGALRGPLQRYTDYMQNRPDVSQKMINAATAGLQNALLNQFKRLNKYLPANAKLPEEFEYPGSAINKLMSLSYVSGLGLRASVPIRDALQVITTTLPIMGPRNFAVGLKNALSSKGFQEAENAGALLHQANIGELYGDIYREIPAGGHSSLDKAFELSNKLLAPSRWGHNVGRAIGYHGTFEAASRGVADLRAGRITEKKFMNDTGLWFLNKPERSRYLTMAMDGNNESKEVAKRIALDMVDRTLWPYRRGTQPGLLRTGAGRIFGQYGMWPMNYTEYLRTIGSRALEGNPRAILAGAMWAGVNLAAYEVLDDGAGIDAGKWLFLSPAGYAGGPHMEFVQNLMKSPEESPDGLKARKEVLEYPLNFIPAMNQTKSVLSTINDPDYWGDDNLPTEKGWLKLMGFRPTNDKEEERESNWTPEQRIRHEGGFNPGKGDIFGDDK
jgi:hypothetical protein